MKSEVSPGLLVGRYRLGSVLGRGGMGVIWLGTDELLLRQVAIKEVAWPPMLEDAERAKLCERALREARTAARLSHPNVVGVYDVVEEDARPWIVMQYLPYPSLREVIAATGPLDPPTAARVGLGVLAALRAAHAAGVLHRDVKPGNVLLGPDNQVVLTDFGIAVADGSSALTTSGAIVGSPSYLAPERARGEQATPAADLWSLGATIYDAVEGRPPFDRDGTLAVLTAVVTDPPDPPARAGALWPVLSGLLAKDPAERTGAVQAERMLASAAAGEAAGDARPATRMTAPLGPEAAVAAEPDSRETDSRETDSRETDSRDPAGREPDSRDPALREPRGWEQAGLLLPRQRAAPLTRPRPAGDVPAPPPVPRESAARAIGRDPAGRRRRVLTLAALTALVAVLAAGIGLALSAGPTRRAASALRSVRSGGGHEATGRPHRATGHHPATRVRNSTGSGPGSASGGGTAPAGRGGSGHGGSSGTGGSAAVPAGFHRYADPTGFSIGVPNGWAVTHSGHLVYVQGPGAPFLIIDQTTHPRPSALADWQQQEAVRRYTYPGYHLIRLVPIAYPQAAQAADWEFTYLSNGELLHVVNRNILVNASHAYALYWSAPQSQWDAVFPIFQTIAATFRPAGPGQGT